MFTLRPLEPGIVLSWPSIVKHKQSVHESKLSLWSPLLSMAIDSTQHLPLI